MDHRVWLDVDQLAEYAGISRSSAYRLARQLSGGRKRHVGLRVSRAAVDAYLAKVDPPAPSTGASLAMPVDSDDEVVFDGLTRRQLREAAGW